MKKVNPLYLVCAVLLMLLTPAACASAGGGDAPDDSVLVYAALNPVSVEIERSVKIFNNNHTDIQIEIHDYSDQGGLDRLRTELVLGKVPDIMEMHYFGTSFERTGRNNSNIKSGTTTSWKNTGNNTLERVEDEYWMPYRQMVQKGYLEDLWPYIENDPELGRDGVQQAPMKAAEVNGGLYLLFMDFRVNTLMGRESVVGERYSWTLEELLDTFSTMPEDSTILRYNATKRDVFFDLLCFALDKYVDRETGTCSFDSEDFRTLVKFLEGFPDKAGLDTQERMANEIVERVRTGRQMLEITQLSWPEHLKTRDAFWGDRAAFPGYPTADGSSGNFFYPMGDVLSMSAVCKHKDAAWEYIRELVKPRRNISMSVEEAKDPVNLKRRCNGALGNDDGRVPFVSIPVNQHDYELMIFSDTVYYPYFYRHFSEKSSISPLEFAGSWKPLAYGPEIHALELMTEADGERFDKLINSTTQLYWPEDDLSDIVWDVLGSYFAGDRTLDQAIALIQNRVGLYLSEQM